MKNSTLVLVLMMIATSSAHAATPAAGSNFEDPNNRFSSMGAKYQEVKTSIGGCAAIAPGNATDTKTVHANYYRTNTPGDAFANAAASGSI